MAVLQEALSHGVAGHHHQEVSQVTTTTIRCHRVTHTPPLADYHELLLTAYLALGEACARLLHDGQAHYYLTTRCTAHVTVV